MTQPITNELMYEVLKALQTDVASIKRDIRTMKEDIISLRAIMAEFLKADTRRESDHLDLAARVERIERRLDLQDRPPA